MFSYMDLNPEDSYDSFDMALNTGLLSAVGNVSDCRSRGREFDPGPVSYFRGDHEIISTAILLPSADSRRVVVSYK